MVMISMTRGLSVDRHYLLKKFRGFFKKKTGDLFGNQMIDTAVRYYPVIELIKRKKLTMKRVLEVGSGVRGMTEFLPIKITGIDVMFDGVSPLVKQVKASALKLPFNNSSFDVVVSVDTLEHLPPGQRKKAIKEILRVAKRWVFIHVPCDEAAFELDKDLWVIYRRLFNSNHPALGEHIRYGLPKTSEIEDWLTTNSQELRKSISLAVRPTLNLGIRKYIMRCWITKSFFLHVLDRTINIVLIPIFARLNFEQCYRRLFIVEINNNNEDV